jgi:hypothetical protein
MVELKKNVQKKGIVVICSLVTPRPSTIPMSLSFEFSFSLSSVPRRQGDSPRQCLISPSIQKCRCPRRSEAKPPRQ